MRASTVSRLRIIGKKLQQGLRGYPSLDQARTLLKLWTPLRVAGKLILVSAIQNGIMKHHAWFNYSHGHATAMQVLAKLTRKVY
jgi:hypothetical protein